VVVREDQPGDLRIVGYVAGAGIDEAALQSRLRAALPAYMVPQHLVALEALPLLPNGKIDRKALPLPRAVVAAVPTTGAADDAAMRDLVGLCTEILGTEVVPDDNFFDAGGHSLLAVKMISRLRRDTGVRLNLLG